MDTSSHSIDDSKLTELVSHSVDLHCHGLGKYDFTDIDTLDLDEVEATLAERDYSCALTLYLAEHTFDRFLAFMQDFDQAKRAGKYPHIAGIGLEGPLLECRGGTPKKVCWAPERTHWELLSECGRLGLIYTIFSPDSSLGLRKTTEVTELLLAGDVLPCPGHFSKTDLKNSVASLTRVFDCVKAWGKGPTLTDHFYNDMPLNFKHAWRDSNNLIRRNEELKAMQLDTWRMDNLDEKLGIIPATMIRHALQGLVKISLNFDGEHVDHAIAKKTVELVGAENLLILTDSTEIDTLSGIQLHKHYGSSLLYQEQEIVAVGSQGIKKQVENMVQIGLTEQEINLMTKEVPRLFIHNQV